MLVDFKVVTPRCWFKFDGKVNLAIVCIEAANSDQEHIQKN